MSLANASMAQPQSYQTMMDARFAKAARHSRLVRLLRVAVPAAVVVALLSIVLLSIFNPFRNLSKLPLEMGNLVVSGTKITMETPHLAGFSEDKRPYDLWARTATQDVTDPDHVDLTTLRAKFLMEDQSTVTMDARTGVFDTKAQILDAREDVFVQTSTGYEARLKRAIVDLAKNTVTSTDPVDVKLLNGTLTSDRMKILEKGELVVFEGHVKMNLNMDPPPAQAAAPEPATPVAKSGKSSAPGKRTSAK